ncbi:MAG: hypothetical protein M1828_001370 [Chrysothrix sp. TS-e1954]|nr:MAG: hypothetical protein M1828_001370 [Chrysothrix sp. TS-e1954]
MANVSRSANRRAVDADLARHPRKRHTKPISSSSTPCHPLSLSPEAHKPKKRRLNDVNHHSAILPPGTPPRSSTLDSILPASEKVNGKRPLVTLAHHEHATSGRSSVQPTGDAQVHESLQTTIEKRVLRSADGTSHSESDLAYFFPDYEDYVFGPTKSPPRLNIHSALFITERKVDADRKEPNADLTPQKAKITPRRRRNLAQLPGTDSDTEPTPAKPLNIKAFNIGSLAVEGKQYSSDPLTDDLYTGLHKKGERKEKSFRIQQHDWAIHEKAMLGRLAEELKGPDWLRTMGISGITETEKKAFEPKRDHYIRAVAAKINQFNAFKDREKALQQERQELIAQRSVGGLDGANDADDRGEVRLDVASEFSSKDRSINEDDAEASAMQLQQEAIIAVEPSPRNEVQPAPSPDKPFVSFFSKHYMRDAAVSKHRRGRSVRAFGLPIPEMESRTFRLPDDVVSLEDFATHARKRRRLKRESKDGLDIGR